MFPYLNDLKDILTYPRQEASLINGKTTKLDFCMNLCMNFVMLLSFHLIPLTNLNLLT